MGLSDGLMGTFENLKKLRDYLDQVINKDKFAKKNEGQGEGIYKSDEKDAIAIADLKRKYVVLKNKIGKAAIGNFVKVLDKQKLALTEAVTRGAAVAIAVDDDEYFKIVEPVISMFEALMNNFAREYYLNVQSFNILSYIKESTFDLSPEDVFHELGGKGPLGDEGSSISIAKEIDTFCNLSKNKVVDAACWYINFLEGGLKKKSHLVPIEDQIRTAQKHHQQHHEWISRHALIGRNLDNFYLPEEA